MTNQTHSHPEPAFAAHPRGAIATWILSWIAVASTFGLSGCVQLLGDYALSERSAEAGVDPRAANAEPDHRRELTLPAVESPAASPTPPATTGADGGIGSSEAAPPPSVDTDASAPIESPTVCDGEEVDLRADSRHCGACGAACSAPSGGDAVCSEGLCAVRCPEGGQLCGDACVDTAGNSEHCGACQAACSADTTCVGGVCVVCAQGASRCQPCPGDSTRECAVECSADGSAWVMKADCGLMEMGGCNPLGHRGAECR